MVSPHSKASGAGSHLPQAMIDLAQGDKGALQAETPSATPVGVEVELALADLVGDANGEVVIFNDSGLRTLALRTDSAVVAGGQSQGHVTAGGEDVSGFNFVSFDTGVTVYFPEGLELIVAK
jgi:hypothetical protein